MFFKSMRRRGALVWLSGGIVLAAYLTYSAAFTRSPRPLRALEPEHEITHAPIRSAPVREPQRPVYPHSIIRGGVYSPTELKQALGRDSVAAVHYAGFRTLDARLDRLDRPRLAYVSYRTGDSVQWTRRAVPLPEGEAVLTDGTNLVRARCGNRISFTPQQPVGPDVDLDTPETPAAQDGPASAGGPGGTSNAPLIVHDLFPPAVGESPNGGSGWQAAGGPAPALAARSGGGPSGGGASGGGTSGGGTSGGNPGRPEGLMSGLGADRIGGGPWLSHEPAPAVPGPISPTAPATPAAPPLDNPAVWPIGTPPGNLDLPPGAPPMPPGISTPSAPPQYYPIDLPTFWSPEPPPGNGGTPPGYNPPPGGNPPSDEPPPTFSVPPEPPDLPEVPETDTPEPAGPMLLGAGLAVVLVMKSWQRLHSKP